METPADEIAVAPVVELSLFDRWPELLPEDRLKEFLALKPQESEELFTSLGARDQASLLLQLPIEDRRSWMRQLAPDDAADVIQEFSVEDRNVFIPLLDRVTRREVMGLLAYAEDEAGGLMSPRYVRLRPDMNVDEAITYLRRQARRPIETISYAYVLDHDQVLLGVVSFRDLLLCDGGKIVSEVMVTDVVTVREHTNQEEISNIFAQHNLIAVPVVDEKNRLMGIVTVDDVIDALREEATEDIQKMGGTEALDAPYLDIGFFEMVKKRASWLAVLFVGEMFTATAMSYYETEIARAVVLALFIPLVISSGGNAGSQASTLVVRAIALGEVRTRQWAKVLAREVTAGLALGVILGCIGFARIMLWPTRNSVYGPDYLMIAFTIAFSLVGIVLWGTIAGSMLPLILRRFGLDPASASAPFVATIVDVTGLVIYFNMARMILGGILL